LVVENADQAVEAACKICQALVKEYTAAPLFAGQESVARHQWVFEFEQEPLDLQKFAETLDEELKKRNSDYEAKRHKNLNLASPALIIARSGLFYDWLKEFKRLGGQAKIPRLANDRQVIEAILNFDNK